MKTLISKRHPGGKCWMRDCLVAFDADGVAIGVIQRADMTQPYPEPQPLSAEVFEQAAAMPDHFDIVGESGEPVQAAGGPVEDPELLPTVADVEQMSYKQLVRFVATHHLPTVGGSRKKADLLAAAIKLVEGE